jgi:hypothetical protein
LPQTLKFGVLAERLAVCRAPAGAPIPAWAVQDELFSVTRTRDELSIVCREDHAASHRNELTVEQGWIALRLHGPFPFSLTGVLASFIGPLADARIPIFAISTFDTDYVLIKGESLEQALKVLRAAGHEVAD